jgi:hypothetical protein
MSSAMSSADTLTRGDTDHAVDDLRARARRCRRLAAGAGDQRITDTLAQLAIEYEAKASELERIRHAG